MFILRFDLSSRNARRLITFLLLTLVIWLTALDDMTVFDADDSVRHLRYRFIVGYHHDSLAELLSCDFQQTQNVLRGLAVEISRRLI